MLDEAQRISGVTFTLSQGSYSTGVEQSAGTHAGGGSCDISISGKNKVETDALVLALRQVGFAAWLRTPDQGFIYHVHAIAGGCSDLSSGARDQWDDYLGGRNGLANNAPDDGPRDFDHVGILWEEYCDQQQPAWFLEGVLLMTAHTIVFFAHRGVTYEADLLAGTYRGLASAKDYEDRLWLLDSMGVPYGQIAEGHETDNLNAFGRLVA